MLLSALRHRELIMRLVKRDLKVRYKSSSLGFLWSIAKPLLLVVIYTIVFDIVLDIGVGAEQVDFHYSLFIMVALMPWIYFASTVGESMQVILGNANLVKKVRLPLEVFPLSSVIGNLIHFLLAMIVVFAFIAWEGVGFSWSALWFPALVLLQSILVVGFALLLSALNVFYRDIASAFEVILTAWLYGTPIIYSIAHVGKVFGFGGGEAKLPQWLFHLYMLNPMTPLILAYRRIFLYATAQGSGTVVPAPEYAFIGANPDLWLLKWVGISTLTSLIIFALSWAIFQHYAKYFADEV